MCLGPRPILRIASLSPSVNPLRRNLGTTVNMVIINMLRTKSQFAEPAQPLVVHFHAKSSLLRPETPSSLDPYTFEHPAGGPQRLHRFRCGVEP